MRIDAHQHFWDLDRFEYTWMPEPPSRLRFSFLPHHLRPILKRNQFDGSVVVQAHTSLDETRWLLELASANDFILGVVGWTDLTGSSLGDTLDELQRHRKFKGVRHPVHDELDAVWLLRDDVLRGLAELARRGLPYDLLIRPAHLPLVPRVADRVPELRMVIDHLAKPPIASGRLDGWAEDIAETAKLPQVYCKLSGLITEAGPQWAAGDLQPYVRHALEVFGPDRLMFGSDWPVCLLACDTWKVALAAFTQAHGPLVREIRDQIIGETAQRFYRLEVAAPGPAEAPAA
jgi:L-fuconolactonase